MAAGKGGVPRGAALVVREGRAGMERQGLKVAMLQLQAVAGDPKRAWAKAEAACREARRAGADLALLPEMWSIGYRFPRRDDLAQSERWRRSAVTLESDGLRAVAGLAAELGMAIAATYLEAGAGRPRNAVTVFDRHGRAVLTYRKVHTCAFADECLLTPGDAFAVAELDTAVGPVRIGAMICFDREFPESARVLALEGAELIVVPNACTWDMHRDRQLQSRAFENMLGIALANYASPDANGGSVAYDGMAYTDGDGADGQARDMTIARADAEEQILLAEFDLAAMRRYRAREVWGAAGYRRPDAYRAITRGRDAPA